MINGDDQESLYEPLPVLSDVSAVQESRPPVAIYGHLDSFRRAVNATNDQDRENRRIER